MESSPQDSASDPPRTEPPVVVETRRGAGHLTPGRRPSSSGSSKDETFRDKVTSDTMADDRMWSLKRKKERESVGDDDVSGVVREGAFGLSPRLRVTARWAELSPLTRCREQMDEETLDWKPSAAPLAQQRPNEPPSSSRRSGGVCSSGVVGASLRHRTRATQTERRAFVMFEEVMR
ncbi:hypothetical protein F2P81_025347 [Scophthalmus maximus]|uniref:Uncharacterized protein n=1 Tax=Scophthalmus maximus TaxID=52904 RepID=A0A6A4RIU1_SCOMX|nr:hypothetical protein F2P81_025347 [Scophthalmus maximus]